MGKMSLKLKIVQAIALGLSFSIMMALFGMISGEKFNLWKSLFLATFFGLVMGIFLPIITKWQLKKLFQKTIIYLNINEKMLYQGASNIKFKSLSTGGKLILTNQRLAFKPYKMNFKNTFVEIPLTEITDVREQNTLGFITNIFIIKTIKDEFKFIVFENQRAIWTTKINDSINN